MKRKLKIILIVTYILVMFIPYLTSFRDAKKEIIKQKEFYTLKCQDLNDENKNYFCNILKNYQVTFSNMWQRLSPGKSEIVFVILPFLLVALYLLPYLKNKVISSFLLRESYSTFLTKRLLPIYAFAFIYSFILLLLGIMTMGFILSINPISLTELKMAFFNALVAFLMFIIIINIALIVGRKVHKPIAYFISSGISFVMFALIFNIIGNKLYDMGYKFGYYFDLTFPINHFYDSEFLLGSYTNINNIIILLILTFISSLIVILCYKNKEKLILDCEKN